MNLQLKKTKVKSMANCIYCGSLGSFNQVEHIFPYSLGGGGQGWTLQNVVCDACNNKFSALEQQLARHSLESLARLGYGPQGRRKKSQKHLNPLYAKGVYRFSEDNDLAYEAGVSLGFKPYIRSQLIEAQIIDSKFSEIQSIQSTEEEFSELMGRVKRFIDEDFYLIDKKSVSQEKAFQRTKFKYDSGTMKSQVEQALQPKPPQGNCVWLQLLPVDSDRKRYTPRIFLDDDQKLIVKAHDIEEAVRFICTVVNSISDKDKGQDVEIGLSAIHIQMQVNFVAVFRALAKIGVNYAIKLYGEEFVRDSAFDEIKAFINGEIYSNLDSAFKYVQMNQKNNLFEFLNCSKDVDKHWIMLAYIPNLGLIFTIYMYGSSGYLVRLGEKKPPVNCENLAIATVDYKKRETSLLNPDEIAKLFLESYSTTFRNQ